MSTRTVSPYRGKTQWFAYTYSQNPEREGRTHHASAFFIPNEDAIGIFGGIGQQTRLSTTSVYTSADNKNMALPILPPEDIGARSCHTITTMGNGQNILVGGRASPSAPMRDCWLQTGSKWERIQDLPEPRFRHRAAGVVLPDNQYGIVVFGGRISATKVAIDVLLWDIKNGWQKLKSLRSDPMPRFGASFVRLGFNHGLLFGGMRHDGVICQGLWRWRLTIRDNVVAGISFKTSTALDTSAGIFPWLARLGASYSVIRNELLLIGGVAKQGCIPKDYEILSILGSFSAFGEYEKEMDLRVACVIPKKDPDVPRPLLIGHSTHRTVRETTLIIGGGATCFSFGTYWNQGCWLLYDRESGVSSHWALVKRNSSKPSNAPPRPEGTIHDPTIVDNIHPCSESDFLRILKDGKPQLLTGLDLGPCISLWTPSYLLSKIPTSQNVVVHAAASRTMNFQRKDFSYTTLTFHNFIKILQNNREAHMYLRSLSSASPTQSPAMFDDDWPSIADDVQLDPSLDFIRRNKHSSPLRISANVNMWLHYDVMANVLFQIRGTRKLIIFPPEDIKHLSFPPGSTTSTMDVFEPAQHPGREEDQLKPIPDTHPYIAILRPGEALFIPPLWSHTGTPLPVIPATPGHSPSLTTKTAPESNSEAANSHINISLNVFFRSLSSTKYPAGRDVYGNRDLAAYEDGRRDLDKIVRRFISNGNGSSRGSKPEAKIPTKGPQENGATPASFTEVDKVQVLESTATPSLNDDEAIFAEGVPKALTKAYLERLADELRERADRL
jgi:tRNA wybutosine-synthesizing protein 4